MAKVYEFLSNGFEDIEALAPVDILRRGGLEVKTVSITGEQMVETTHGIKLMTDLRIEDIADFSDVDAMLLPGGLPGATNLNKHRMLREILLEQYNQGRIATCYPGFEKRMTGATYTQEQVTIDGNIITGKGPGASMDFGYAILGKFVAPEAVAELKAQMMYKG